MTKRKIDMRSEVSVRLRGSVAAVAFLDYINERVPEGRSLDAAVQRGERAEEALRGLLVAIGEDVRHVAPELLAKAAQAYISEDVEAKPNAEGWWWLGDDVVRVRMIKGDLRVLRGNRYKSVEELYGWGGLALREPRAADDIPF